MIEYYIVEFEQNGSNRAAYGTNLLESLSGSLGIKGLDCTMLNLCRVFYQKYPQIRDSVNHKFQTDPKLLLTHLSFTHLRQISTNLLKLPIGMMSMPF